MQADEQRRVRQLLEHWAYWRGSVVGTLLTHMRPRCTLGRLVRAARQEGEIWPHNEVPSLELPDDLMAQVDRIVCGLESGPYRVIRMTYCEGRYLSPKQRQKRLRMGKSAYYEHLRAGHEAVWAGIEWRNVLIA